MAKKKGLTWQEIIERIEQAPKEMQTMVAKAFIRDDIDNDNVQYLFNTDGLDILNETGENENIDARGVSQLELINPEQETKTL